MASTVASPSWTARYTSTSRALARSGGWDAASVMLGGAEHRHLHAAGLLLLAVHGGGHGFPLGGGCGVVTTGVGRGVRLGDRMGRVSMMPVDPSDAWGCAAAGLRPVASTGVGDVLAVVGVGVAAGRGVSAGAPRPASVEFAVAGCRSSGCGAASMGAGGWPVCDSARTRSRARVSAEVSTARRSTGTR